MDVFTDIAQKYISNKLIAGLEWDVKIKDKTLSRGVAGYKDSKSKEPLKENYKKFDNRQLLKKDQFHLLGL